MYSQLLSLLLLIFIQPNFVRAQSARTGNIKNKQAAEIRMLLTSDNVLYIGSGNPFVVKISGKSTMEVEVKISTGFISRSDTCYFAQVDSGNSAEIKVYMKSGGKEVKAGTYKFPVKRMPSPEPVIAGKFSGDTISKEVLLKNPKMEVYMKGMNAGVLPVFTIGSFTMNANIGGVMNKKIAKSGGSFTAEQISLIKKAKSGTKISFENIKARGYDGGSYNLAPMVVTIK
jgi:hypothetical protein